MTFRTAVLMIIVAAGASRAAAQDVKVDWDRTARFAIYDTYSWSRDTRLTGNALLDRRIVDAIDAQLHAGGLRYSDRGDGDVMLAAYVATKDRAMLNGFYADWRGSNWGGVGATGIVDELTQGTLIVDIFDAQTGRLVWRAMATGSISNNPKKNAKRVSKAIEKMFRDLPPMGPLPSSDR